MSYKYVFVERWKDVVKKLGHKTLPGVDEVFSYVEGGTNTFMPDTKDMQLTWKSWFTINWWYYETLASLHCYWIIHS